ncbi:hypothetical protein [Nocardia australiensis]|uniref:hypothetical protein n=1 Tax=Nocardia australiensis TaxID=2887191 RepID=UPI001D148C61|nr:hypothetical protein [Nocardia australiensis]
MTRTRSPRACRPRQAARLIRGTWTVDDRWAGVASVPRSAAAVSMMDVNWAEVDAPSESERPVRRDADQSEEGRS